MSAEVLPDDPLFAYIREACAEVARRSRMVRIDGEGLEGFAAFLAQTRPTPPSLDPAHLAFPEEATTVAFALTLNAVNFGSGWFPHLKKNGELSGYRTVATALRKRFQREGPFSAKQLERITRAECAALFGQDESGEAGELMGLFAAAWNELGRYLITGYGGAFAGPVKEARGHAERLVRLLARMPMYQDVATYQGFRVPFLKRAQITVADLAVSLRGEDQRLLKNCPESGQWSIRGADGFFQQSSNFRGRCIGLLPGVEHHGELLNGRKQLREIQHKGQQCTTGDRAAVHQACTKPQHGSSAQYT